VTAVSRAIGVRFVVVTAVLLVVLTLPLQADAASPSESVPPRSPSASATAGTIVIDTGDPRSNGQGPGLVGSPFAIAIGVVLLGLIAAAGTLLYVRVADRR
jgi:hypothetical protein